MWADAKLPVTNRLLGSMPDAAQAYLRTRLAAVRFEHTAVLLRAEQRIGHVYFPDTGLVSLVAHLSNGRTAEVGVVGLDGMVGLPVLLGSQHTYVEWMVQVPGVLWRMEAQAFRSFLGVFPDVRDALLKYALTFYDQVTQTAACNVTHTLDQRLARWLLMVQDRTGDEIAITQELLGMMLGVRRAGITIAAGLLQRAGVIRYAHGKLRITDRAGLESCACECYMAGRRRSREILSAE